MAKIRAEKSNRVVNLRILYTSWFIFFLVFGFIENSDLHAQQSEGKIFPFFQETLIFNVVWKGVNVGNVSMKTKLKEEKGVLQTYSKINTFSLLNSFYYIGGYFGAEWSYKTRKPVRAFEEVYQGKNYQKRAFYFKDSKVLIDRHEKTFSEYNYPHTGDVVNNTAKKEWIDAPEFQDLLGAFYSLRSSGQQMKVGEIARIKVLPAGSKKILILKVMAKKNIETDVLGKKMVFHVRSGIASVDQEASGGDVFFKTKSPIEMYITADENAIPVKIWTNMEYVGKIEIILGKYSQP